MVSKETLAIYSSELQLHNFDLEDIRTALREMGRKPRAQFETAYPVLPDVLAAVRKARHARLIPPMPSRRYLPTYPVEFKQCGRKHYRGNDTFLDRKGNPCDETEPDRQLGVCPCYREYWREANEYCRKANEEYERALRDSQEKYEELDSELSL